MKISTELREFVQAIDPDDRTDEHNLMQRAADILDEKDRAIFESIDAIQWAIKRIEALKAENARLLKLLS